MLINDHISVFDSTGLRNQGHKTCHHCNGHIQMLTSVYDISHLLRAVSWNRVDWCHSLRPTPTLGSLQLQVKAGPVNPINRATVNQGEL